VSEAINKAVDEWKEKKGISEEDDDVDIYFKV
jgi:hypothetical protein